MKRLLCLCLLPALLTGCATTREYQHKLSSWVGESVDSLYSVFGSPSSTEQQPDGGKVVTYEHKEVVPVAPAAATAASTANAAHQPEAPPPEARTVSCTTRYKADSSGIIRSWTFDGNGCQAHEIPTETPAPPKP